MLSTQSLLAEMAGNENLAISEISLSSKDDPGQEEVDIGFRVSSRTEFTNHY